MKLIFAAGVLGIMMSSSNVFAHSAYYDCAVRSGGSVEDVARNCGYRSDFDRTGRVGPDNGFGRGGFDHGRGNDYGRDNNFGRGNDYGRGGYRGGRRHLNSVTPSIGSCFSEANGQGEEMVSVSAEACAAMGGQSFVPSEM